MEWSKKCRSEPEDILVLALSPLVGWYFERVWGDLPVLYEPEPALCCCATLL